MILVTPSGSDSAVDTVETDDDAVATTGNNFLGRGDSSNQDRLRESSLREALISNNEEGDDTFPADWPAEAGLILSALECGRGLAITDRRAASRRPLRTKASLKLFSDTTDNEPWILFTRDVDTRGFGFITRHRLPLGFGGMITLTLPNGRELRTHCTLLRCREAAPGWFEGALSFNRPQKVHL
jgi:hypothetical protein